MAVSRYFGLPGCGKTTMLAKLAYDAIRSGKYNHVYSNVHLAVPGVQYVPFEYFGTYEISDGLYLVDEATINAGDRDYKAFGRHKMRALMEHRHANLDIVFFSQEADGMDKKIRSITDRVYYVRKSRLNPNWTYVYRVPYKIIWPDGKSDGGENAGRILMGYVRPPLSSRIFALRFSRKKYYPYFDSWERDPLPPLPAECVIYGQSPASEPEAACG